MTANGPRRAAGYSSGGFHSFGRPAEFDRASPVARLASRRRRGRMRRSAPGGLRHHPRNGSTRCRFSTTGTSARGRLATKLMPTHGRRRRRHRRGPVRLLVGHPTCCLDPRREQAQLLPSPKFQPEWTIRQTPPRGEAVLNQPDPVSRGADPGPLARCCPVARDSRGHRDQAGMRRDRHRRQIRRRYARRARLRHHRPDRAR